MAKLMLRINCLSLLLALSRLKSLRRSRSSRRSCVPGGVLYVRLTYRTTQPVGFIIDGYAAGQKVRKSSSNIAPGYPPGAGQALV